MAVLTKSAQVESQLRKRILAGEWAAGQRLPAERELYRSLGVGQRTVREALISLANDGLINRRQGAGTFVSKDCGVSLVAILGNVGALGTPFGYVYRRLVEELGGCVLAAGFKPQVCLGYGNTKKEFGESLHILERPFTKHLVGVISTVHMGPLEERLSRTGISAVSILVASMGGPHSVVFNYAELIRLAVGLLGARGYDDFSVMYHFNEEDRPGFGEYVLSGLRSCVPDFPRDRLVPVPQALDFADAYEAFKRWWAGPRRSRAMFFLDDGLADVALRAVLELGIKVPEELAIVSHANVGRDFGFPVPLTCVEFDPAEAATAAWKMLGELIDGENGESKVVHNIDPRIRMGQSL